MKKHKEIPVYPSNQILATMATWQTYHCYILTLLQISTNIIIYRYVPQEEESACLNIFT